MSLSLWEGCILKKKMSQLLIASPSKNRLDFTIGRVLGEKVILFVEPQDYESYRANTDLELVKIAKNDQGFGYVLNQIIDYSLDKGVRFVLFADDDIFGLKDKSGKRVEDVDLFLSQGIGIMDKEGYSQLMVSFSGHNWYTKVDIKENVGCWGMIFLDVKKISSVGGYDTGLKIFNDWDMSARLLQAGEKTACWYQYQFEHKMKSKKGGAFALYQNQSFMKEQCDKIVLRYGNAARILFHEKHQQYEVRFQWKKLFRNKKGISEFIYSGKRSV